MLPRLALGFAGVLTAAIAISACSSSDATSTISVGPTFSAQTLYAADVTQNAISIYTPSPKSTAAPVYQIGGSSTTLAGPQYMTFDNGKNLWVTNWLSSTSTGVLLQFLANATGNVVPYQTLSLGTIRPRGIAFMNEGTTASPLYALAIAVTDPTESSEFSSGIAFYQTNAISDGEVLRIAGPATELNVPSGIAIDSKNNIYVSNLQGASVTVFAFPGSTATPSPTPSPTATASSTASPTASPTATPDNIAPEAMISGATTGLGQPTGIALDASGNIYVSDQAAKITPSSSGDCTPGTTAIPAILIFPAGSNGAVAPKCIAGSNTKLVAPTDVAVDKSGNVYVADELSGTGVIYVFAAGSTGNVAPSGTLNSPGSLIGLALTP